MDDGQEFETAGNRQSEDGLDDNSIEPKSDGPAELGKDTDGSTTIPPVKIGLTLLSVVLCSTLAICGWWLIFNERVAAMPKLLLTPRPVEVGSQHRPILRYPESSFVTVVASFRDELFAYLMYQYYRTSPVFAADEVLLQYSTKRDDEARYCVVLVLGDDFISAINRIAELYSSRMIEDFDWLRLAPATLTRYRNQTRIFVSAYNLPVKTKVERLSKVELRRLLRRFIRYKSATDPRIRKRLEPIPEVLSATDARRVAADMIDVADFFQIPLELLIGIGAMENNYMNVRGDRTNSIWKHHAGKDDIVLERRNGRVRVLNDSVGIWQITRETLRWVHRLYLNDKRDYSRLPDRLRPPRELDFDEVTPGVLTTYAGLFLRYLLDRFNGDVALAAGAYNGGPGNPNAHYQEGVQAAATHARAVLERAAALNGDTVIHKRWFR